MRRIETVLKTLSIIFILLVFFSVPVMGFSWKLWSSLDKSQYSADSYVSPPAMRQRQRRAAYGKTVRMVR
jgi:hypothetical protein